MKRAWLLVLVALGGCNPSLVREGDPLHENVGTWYYLSMPLSGPRFRHGNMFGQRPFLGAGARVRVTAMERVPASFDSDWGDDPQTVHYLDHLESQQVYRIYFDGPPECTPKGCEAHWRLPDDDAFQARFDRIFVQEDPLEGLPPDRRELIEAHRVASWMTAEEVVLAIGEPNYVVTAFERANWIYEERICDADDRLLAIPKLELAFQEGRLADHQTLSRFDFYVLLEPRRGLCFNPIPDAGPSTVLINSSGAAVNLSLWGGDPFVWDQLSRMTPTQAASQLNRLANPTAPPPTGATR